MVLEIKYVNAVIHTENSKLLLDLNCSPKELEKTVVNSCGIERSAAKRGFTDHSSAGEGTCIQMASNSAF